jgi:bifunctional UDP-N-acetylglucosamine pyrophosphorylase / glucosamine-1-phosphate N-acetyltransferase
MDKKNNNSINQIKKNKVLMLEYAEKLINQGALIIDPERIDIRGELICGKNVVIDINVIFEGKVVLKDNVSIGANCILIDSTVDENSSIRPFSLIEGAVIGKNSFVGPFGRIRHGSVLDDFVQIGNFVEVKNSTIMKNVNAHHLSFIGDAHIESGVTIGAGTITCNHDGLKNNQTFIGKGAYIGSGSNLIAPIKIGNNATIAAGSTLNNDAPEDKLTIARSRQTTVDEWQNPKKKFDDTKEKG